jgi:hypothetical protein
LSGAFVVPDAWKTVRLVLIRPSGWPHAAAIIDVMETLMHGFRALGIAADIGENQALAGAINIYFMAFLLGQDDIPRLHPDSIIYNFEQAGGDIGFLTPSFRAALARCRVWDYSPRNMERLAPLIGHDRRQVVPVGYVPALSRIPRAPVQDIDVLFYGALNERRRRILVGLQHSGLRLHTAFGVYGAERDALIARSKLVLNIHAHPAKVLEVVRISYLLANRKAVVTEMDAETEADPDLRDAVAGAPYDRIIEECRRLVADAEARQHLEDRGYTLFQKRDIVPVLRRAITEAA